MAARKKCLRLNTADRSWAFWGCFPGPAMAFRDLDEPELRNMPGYGEFLNTPLSGDLLVYDIPKCQRLLLLFKKNIR